MKFLFFFTYNRSFLSGFFLDLCKKLTEAGHSVTVFSFKGINNEKKVDNIDIHIKKKRGYLANYYNTYKIIRDIKPDIIISNFSYVYPALLAGKLIKGCKNIAWFHTESSHTKPGVINLIIKKRFTKLADRIIVNSYRLKEDLINTCTITENKIYIVPFWTAISSVISSNFRAEKPKLFNIGCPGRLVKGKNQELVLDALSMIKATNTKTFKLYFAGQGDQEEYLRKYTSTKNLYSETEFLGDLSINDMPQFYKEMDLIVLPSLQEAFGMVFLEAMSLEVPVLVSDRFGALDFLSSEVNLNAFQFNPLDEKELADKIKLYMEGKGCSPAYFKTLYNKHFSREKTFHSFMKVLQE
ncbi:MAG: hypothetical protein CMC13_11490 [Flavobacteriaceae bacterium]|nr:hypothetical protein [Flavobacteriaceae bacterium]|tara:strand:- start:25 stop:1086 length:1062 start_codon:yes stop_codon:yes gene_type:complete